MGRLPRIHFSGAVYHVMARGVDGRDIFLDDYDRAIFLNALNRCAGDSGAVIMAYCLMGNHFHLAIKVGETPLSFIIQRLLTGYSLTFNRRHKRTGHLFQARYKAIVCTDDRYLFALMSYIHLNPVRAGMVSRAQDWPWSSFSDKQGKNETQDDLVDFDPWQNDMDHGCELLRNDDGEGPDIGDIGVNIAKQTGVPIELMRSGNRRRFVIEAKKLLTREAVRHGHTLGAVARWLRVSPSTMTRYFGPSNAKTDKPDTTIAKK